MIHDSVVFWVLDKRTVEAMLRQSKLPLKDSIDICGAATSLQNQLAEIRREDAAALSEVTSGSNSGIKCFTCDHTQTCFARLPY